MIVSSINLIEKKSKTIALNICDIRMLYWLSKNFSELNRPIILQISQRVYTHENECILKLVNELFKSTPIKVALYLDHCKDIEVCYDAIKNGFSGILFDCSHLAFDENLSVVTQFTKFAKQNHVSVEAELSPIPGVEDEQAIMVSRNFSVEQVIEYVNKSQVHFFAPYFGNKHGLYCRSEEKFDLEYLEKVNNALSIPIVIHGGSGFPQEVIRFLNKIEFGKINFSTEFKNLFERPFTHKDVFQNNKQLESDFCNTMNKILESYPV